MTQVLLGLLLFLYLITANLLYFVEIRNSDANIKNYGDALWLTVITFATIGYGDRFAVTSLGRIITVIAATGGIALYAGLGSALLTGISILVQRAEAGELGIPVKNHAIICNWHEEAETLIQELLAGDTPIQDAVVVSRGERPFEAQTHWHFVSGDPSDEATLRRANINQATAIIVFPPEEEVLREGEIADSLSLMLAVTVKEMSPAAWRGVFVQRKQNMKHFEGVNAIINDRRIGSMIMVQALQDPGVELLVQELLSNLEGQTLFTCQMPSKRFVNWGSLSSYCRTQNWLAVAIRREKKVVVNPPDNTALVAGDEMIIIAHSRPIIQ